MIFLEIEIPLPSFEEQTIIIAEIEKQRAIIEGADKVLCNWKIQESDFIREGINYNNLIIDDFASVGTGSTPSREIDEYFKGENNWVLTTEVAMNEIFDTTEKLSDKAIQDYGLRVYPKYNPNCNVWTREDKRTKCLSSNPCIYYTELWSNCC